MASVRIRFLSECLSEGRSATYMYKPRAHSGYPTDASQSAQSREAGERAPRVAVTQNETLGAETVLHVEVVLLLFACFPRACAGIPYFLGVSTVGMFGHTSQGHIDFVVFIVSTLLLRRLPSCLSRERFSGQVEFVQYEILLWVLHLFGRSATKGSKFG